MDNTQQATGIRSSISSPGGVRRELAWTILRAEAGRHYRHADALTLLANALDTYYANLDLGTSSCSEEDLWRWLQAHRDLYTTP